MSGLYYTSEEIFEIKGLLELAVKRLADTRSNSMLIQIPIEKAIGLLNEHGLQVTCGECGTILNTSANIVEHQLWVEPCPKCLEAEGERAIQEEKDKKDREETEQSILDEEIRACLRRV